MVRLMTDAHPLLIVLIAGLVAPACQSSPTGREAKPVAALAAAPEEVQIKRIPLTGPAADRRAELSGLAWYGDQLLLMPQYPDRFPHQDGPDDAFAGRPYGSLFTISRADLQRVIDADGDSTDIEPIRPDRVAIIAPDLNRLIPGMQGFEAIAVAGDRIFATIEAELPDRMNGWLLRGEIAHELGHIRFDTEHMVEIRPNAPIGNASEETLVIIGDRVIAIYEANGANINPAPKAHVFDFELQARGTVAFPNIEYRTIDASRADERGRFWVSNCFYVGDRDSYRPAADPLVNLYGQGPSHKNSEIVERLLLLSYDQSAGIQLVERPPVQLQLESETRNWEGLVRFDRDGDTQGFIVATDMFPETILGYVAVPGS